MNNAMNSPETKITDAQLAELRDLGTVEVLDSKIILTVPFAEEDDEVTDDEEESFPARVEHIVPSALCEHTQWYENEEHQLEITFPLMRYFVFGNGGSDDILSNDFDTLDEARKCADDDEVKYQQFDAGRGFGSGGCDAFIVRAVNTDHAKARAARGPYEVR